MKGSCSNQAKAKITCASGTCIVMMVAPSIPLAGQGNRQQPNNVASGAVRASPPTP